MKLEACFMQIRSEPGAGGGCGGGNGVCVRGWGGSWWQGSLPKPCLCFWKRRMVEEREPLLWAGQMQLL